MENGLINRRSSVKKAHNTSEKKGNCNTGTNEDAVPPLSSTTSKRKMHCYNSHDLQSQYGLLTSAAFIITSCSVFLHNSFFFTLLLFLWLIAIAGHALSIRFSLKATLLSLSLSAVPAAIYLIFFPGQNAVISVWGIVLITKEGIPASCLFLIRMAAFLFSWMIAFALLSRERIKMWLLTKKSPFVFVLTISTNIIPRMRSIFLRKLAVGTRGRSPRISDYLRCASAVIDNFLEESVTLAAAVAQELGIARKTVNFKAGKGDFYSITSGALLLFIIIFNKLGLLKLGLLP